MKNIAIVILCAVTLSGCVTFGYQINNETGEYSWKSIGLTAGTSTVPIVQLKF